jgi:retron-type reverse transcriptase
VLNAALAGSDCERYASPFCATAISLLLKQLVARITPRERNQPAQRLRIFACATPSAKLLNLLIVTSTNSHKRERRKKITVNNVNEINWLSLQDLLTEFVQRQNYERGSNCVIARRLHHFHAAVFS